MAHGNDVQKQRTFWYQLHYRFFDIPEVKELRSFSGGDTYAFIYLKLLALSAETSGYLYFRHEKNNLPEELAEQTGERELDLRITINYLCGKGLAIECEDALFLVGVQDQIGSRSKAAELKERQRKNEYLLKKNAKVLLNGMDNVQPKSNGMDNVQPKSNGMDNVQPKEKETKRKKAYIDINTIKGNKNNSSTNALLNLLAVEGNIVERDDIYSACAREGKFSVDNSTKIEHSSQTAALNFKKCEKKLQMFSAEIARNINKALREGKIIGNVDTLGENVEICKKCLAIMCNPTSIADAKCALKIDLEGIVDLWQDIIPKVKANAIQNIQGYVWTIIRRKYGGKNDSPKQ